jgi:hypothetical protein
MDLARMLQKCRRDQWSVDDLDWNVAPPILPRVKEEAIVQYFTDMAGIERLAAALFEAQGRKTHDPVLKDIFATFVVDEERHAEVAARLARHYDVHRYRDYHQDDGLTHFRPHFLAAIEYLPPEIANGYVTAGELLLDVALLRSLNDYVDDEMSHRAMELINRDESRHIAIDFHMIEVYSSDEFLARRRARPSPPLTMRARGAWALGHMIWYATPFLRNARFVLTLQRMYNHPIAGRLFGRAILRAMGADDRIAQVLYTDEELARAQRMSFEELAREATEAKYVS